MFVRLGCNRSPTAPVLIDAIFGCFEKLAYACFPRFLHCCMQEMQGIARITDHHRIMCFPEHWEKGDITLYDVIILIHVTTC